MRSKRNESGAVAILVATLSVVLLATAAMSVDLGNAWARKREVQKQVDLAALAAGEFLPADTEEKKTAVRATVRDYLNSVNNTVSGQDVVTMGDLLNADMQDGAVLFSNDDERIRVLAPAAWVEFGLASAVGFAGVNVLAEATVEVQSEVPVSVFPFALPSSCPYGPGYADTSGGGGPLPPPPPGADYVPTNGETGSHSIVSNEIAPTASTVEGDPPGPLTFEVTGLPNNTTQVGVTFRLGQSQLASYTSTAFATVGTGQSAQNAVRDVEVTIDGAVVDSPGTWRVWVIAGNKYSTNSLEFEVSSSEPPPPASEFPGLGCAVSAEGNFGQLDSPGWSIGQRQPRFAYNIAAGLDHTVVPFTTATRDYCATGDAGNADVMTGSRLDQIPLPNKPNCLNIDSGNDGPYIMEGLVTGVAGHGGNPSLPGRLNKYAGTQRETSSACPVSVSDTVVNGHQINNDKLWCYLRGGATDIAALTSPTATPTILNPEVTKSPRFVWIPVTRAANRIGDRWQPIKTFVPAFITGEGTANVEDIDDDGITWSGNSISSLSVFSFNPATLPPSEKSPSVDYDEALGLNGVIRLID